jgi:hypothetical protein
VWGFAFFEFCVLRFEFERNIFGFLFLKKMVSKHDLIKDKTLSGI